MFSPLSEGCPQGGVSLRFSRINEKPIGLTFPKNTMEIVTTINSIPIYRRYISNLPYNANLKYRARALRKAGNFAEVLFWLQVHKNKFHSIDFDRQRVIGNYIVDFYIVALGMAIEIYGDSHNEKEDYDNRREEFLTSLGIVVWRVSDLRAKFDLENVMQELEAFIISQFGKAF